MLYCNSCIYCTAIEMRYEENNANRLTSVSYCVVLFYNFNKPISCPSFHCRPSNYCTHFVFISFHFVTNYVSEM